MADLQPIQGADRAGLLALLGRLLTRGRQSTAERVEPHLAAPGRAGSADANTWVESGSKPTRPSPQSVKIDPQLRIAPPDEHAHLLLNWLQQAFPNGADVPATEVMEMHLELELEHQLAPIGWIPVARRLREMTGGGKLYISQGRNRIRAYRIPPSSRAAGGVVALPTSRRMAA